MQQLFLIFKTRDVKSFSISRKLRFIQFMIVSSAYGLFLFRLFKIKVIRQVQEFPDIAFPRINNIKF